jgi:diguanylate cyclase (GGDEF)-like protein
MAAKVTFVKRYVFGVCLLWSLACVIALVSHLQNDYEQTVERVKVRAQTMLERDILYRDWVAGHGGVYVPVTDSSIPNPHLEFLPERDILTDDGERLTLINPSYMTHQAFEQDNLTAETVSRITSLKVLNEENVPDEWESQALKKIEKGVSLVSEVVDIEGTPHVRTIRPFYIEDACLKCHEVHGYKVGDIRGGLSISIPIDAVAKEDSYHDLLSVSLFLLLWGTGFVVIVALGRKLHAQTIDAVESDRRRDHAEMSLNFLSNYDRRTNLPNRFKFEEQVNAVMPLVDEAGGSIAVMVLEVRNCKQIVDTFDFPVGDKIFKLLAEKIAMLLEPNDSVARFGEDRLLLSYTSTGDSASPDDMLPKILAEAGRSLSLENHEFFPVVCIGASLYPEDAADATRLVHRAVSALTFCLECKQSGLELYSQSLQEFAKSRLEIEGGLRRSLVEDGFELYLQPQVDSVNEALIGAEALMRWKFNGNFVSPEKFIPIAEASGLILPIGEWVLRTAGRQAVELYKRFGRIIPVGVNVSAKQFQDPDFIDIIDSVLAGEGMSAEMIEIEITEGTFIEDIDRTIELLTDLKIRGLQIAIDDFGTGYSSLSYLNQFPIDRLKIDRSFVIDIAESKDDRILVSLIAEMGRKLGLNVIAEGVEDNLQKNLLLGMGCHAMQGYLFGRPLPFEEFCDHVAAIDNA